MKLTENVIINSDRGRIKVMNIRIYLIVVIVFLGTITPVISYSVILLPPDHSIYGKERKVIDPDILFNELENYHSYRSNSYRDLASYPYTKESKITDSNKLLKELENYESYRPSSYSDLSRNPFGEKRYKNLKFMTKDHN